MMASFKTKLILSYFFLVFISLGFIAFFLDRNLEEKTFQEIKSRLINEASLIENQISSSPSRLNDIVYLDKLIRQLGGRIKSRITIIDLRGRVLADSEVGPEQVEGLENHLNRLEIIGALKNHIGSQIRYSSTLKIDMLYLAIPIKINNTNAGVLRLALPLTSVQKVLLAVRKTIVVGLFFTLGLAFVLASVFSKAIIGPINRIIRISSKFAQGDFSRRIFYSSSDEIGRLSETLNNMAQDIEENIRQIATKNQHLEAIFNSMVEGVIVIDNSSKIISINHTIEGLFNVDKDKVEGRLFLEGIRNSEISEVLNNSMQSAKPISKEIMLLIPLKRVIQINISPIFEKNKVIGSVAVVHDITQIRNLETMRSDFVANVSHELKTPLTSIKGFVETLINGAMEDKKNSKDFLKIIQDHAERLNSLVNDLLDLSYLESKSAELELSRLDISELIKNILLSFGFQLKQNKVEAANNIVSGTFVKADRDKIEQVMTNLIDNAIKFNKEGGFIKVNAEDLGSNLKVIVEDSGQGIPIKDAPRIFERFYRVDKARSRQLGGTGLGLSIVKHIIELHGGSVGVESTEGLGSKFWFILSK